MSIYDQSNIGTWSHKRTAKGPPRILLFDLEESAVVREPSAPSTQAGTSGYLKKDDKVASARPAFAPSLAPRALINERKANDSTLDRSYDRSDITSAAEFSPATAEIDSRLL